MVEPCIDFILLTCTSFRLTRAIQCNMCLCYPRLSLFLLSLIILLFITSCELAALSVFVFLVLFFTVFFKFKEVMFCIETVLGRSI